MSFNYAVDGTVLVDPARALNVRLIEGLAGDRAELNAVAYRNGVRTADRHWAEATLVALDVDLAGSTGAEIFAAHHAVSKLLKGGIRTLSRTDPDAGAVQARILSSDTVTQGTGPERFRWRYPVWLLDGGWEEVTASTSESDLGLGTTGTIGPFTPGGSMRTSPVLTITCQADGSNPAVTEPVSGDALSVVDSFVTSDVIVVDVPNSLVTVNGTRAKNVLSINRGYWMEFEPDVAVSLDWTATSGTWDVATEVKDRYR